MQLEPKFVAVKSPGRRKLFFLIAFFPMQIAMLGNGWAHFTYLQTYVYFRMT